MNINTLEAAANRIHSRAHKFTMRQFAAMTAITIGLAAVTSATFSQEPTATEGKAKAEPMTLPTPTAKPLWIESKDGRKIAARVMARDDKGITVQRFTATGYEEKSFEIQWEDLGPSARQMLDGETTWEEIRQERMAKAQAELDQQIDKTWNEPRRQAQAKQALINEKFARLKELRNKFSAMSAREQQKALVENGKDIQVYLSQEKLSREDGAITHVSPSDAGKTIVIPEDKDEVVSLRPEFEKLGVTATQQIGDSCSVYSAYHLMQFITRKNGVKPASIENFSSRSLPTSNGDSVMMDQDAVQTIAHIMGKPIKVTWIQSSLNNLNHEIVKALLRRGVPVTLSWRPTKEDGYEEGNGRRSLHASVVVGFRVKEGVTEWEVLDSNQIWKDNGYKFIGTQGTVGIFGIEVK